jgi:hypothetical protein
MPVHSSATARRWRDPVPMTKLSVSILSAILATAGLTAGRAQDPATSDPLQRVFARLYDYDFAGAHAMLDERAQADPGNPLVYSTKAVAYLFAEMDRMKILETDFFLNDENLVDGHGRNEQPDPNVKRRLFAAIDQARAKAGVRLAADPNDRDALFAMCMAAGITADYTGFIERRQWRGLTLSRETKKYADKLLALNPPVYDAYMNVGALEYVVGSLPFFVRWFVRIDRLDADKRKGIEDLKLVARHGRYYGPFARILLSVVSLREKKFEDARQLLAGLASEYPENTLIQRELKNVTARLNTVKGRRK